MEVGVSAVLLSSFVLSGDGGEAGEVTPNAEEMPALTKDGGGLCPMGAAFITNKRKQAQ
jgi:hypothetical protein